MATFEEIKREIFADGHLSADEVKKLEAWLYGGEGMNQEKGNILFELKNHGISKEKQIPEFKKLFIEAICKLLLEDEISPGEIDDNEAKWLRGKIQTNGARDELDEDLLDNLRERSINFPKLLNYKSKRARRFESFLYFSRFLTIFAVVGSILSAIALFVKGTYIAFSGIVEFFRTFNSPEGDYEDLLEVFVSSVDIYLFAMVLVIFGVGIYELFISKIDPVERMADPRPTWLQVSSVDDLKSSLGKVILMILIVSFFKHSLDIHFDTAKDLLLLAIGVLLISAALYLVNTHHSKTGD